MNPPYHAESCQDCSVRGGNRTAEYCARCRGLSPSWLNKITTLQVLIVRLLQMQKFDDAAGRCSSIKNGHLLNKKVK